MRRTAILSFAVGAAAMTFLAPAPRASAMTTAAPAAIDAVAPNAQVETVRYVCRRYRVHRHGRWYWRSRCFWARDDYRPYRPHHYYRPYRW